jgi:hypothetical protein
MLTDALISNRNITREFLVYNPRIPAPTRDWAVVLAWQLMWRPMGAATGAVGVSSGSCGGGGQSTTAQGWNRVSLFPVKQKMRGWHFFVKNSEIR